MKLSKKISDMTNDELLKLVHNPNIRWLDRSNPNDKKMIDKETESPGRPRKK